MFTIGEGFK